MTSSDRPSNRPGATHGSDPAELAERVEKLTARNEKLLDTLKDARQQLLALREEVDRLGQPPSGFGVLIEVCDEENVDVFTSGRKMRLTLSPNIDAQTLQRELQLDNPSVSLEQTMVAMQKSQLGFQATLQVRNRLVQAYSEIMNMQV